MTRWFRWMMASLAVSALAACGGGDGPDKNLAEVAQANELSALAAAASKAGLAATLADPDVDLTVFAPTDAAFDALAMQLGYADAAAMVDALPASALADVLRYHVLGTRLNAERLAKGGASQPTLYEFDGAPATLAVGTSSGITLTDAALTTATVTHADRKATNGVLHVIDKVLVPPGVLNVVQMAQVNPSFSTLVGAVVSADLQGALAGSGPFTVFAPTNDAFAAIAETVAGLSQAQLTTVLTYHVLSGQVLSTQIPFGSPVTTLAGQTITIQADPLSVVDTTTEPAPIVATDVRASNGVIHVISKVLLPAL